MSPELPDRTLPHETIKEMVSVIRPNWTVREANLADAGHTSVYHLSVDDGNGTGEYILKASPDSKRRGIDTEARLMTIVDKHTSIPVPRVVGAVDKHDHLPSPFFIMAELPGKNLPLSDIKVLSDQALRRVAHETGKYLGELHSLDGVNKFGVVDTKRTESLKGERPSGDITELTVSNATTSWRETVGKYVDRELKHHKETRFNDLTPEIRDALETRLMSLSGPFIPVVARIDHGLHNILIDTDTGRIEGVLDWAFTLSTTAGYDLVCVEFVLSASVWSRTDEVPDRRGLVREAILEGYESTAGEIPQEYHEHYELYDLLAYTRAMNHIESGVASVVRHNGNVNEAAEGVRKAVEEIVGI
ncbi:MAG: aminoglycoside phosphotransferase family protein [Halobacteria archaeon]|nr:aminoglycoside phosphotransferase family protein [Halobacteria archaeon]